MKPWTSWILAIVLFSPACHRYAGHFERFSTEIKLTNMSQLTSQENTFCTPLMPDVFRGIHHSPIKVSGYKLNVLFRFSLQASRANKDWTR
jgi:hypothetical protein